ncbi:peroxiredoxin family protein [Acidobacteriota bacterium]
MPELRRTILIALIVIFLLTGCGQKDLEKAGESVTDEALPITFESEDQVVAQVSALKEAEKTEEALNLLSRAQKQFPNSFTILGEKFRILRAENRYKECLQMINENMSHFTEEKQKRLVYAKQLILLPIVQSELEVNNPDQAFIYLEEMANAGYRGFHQLKHSEVYEPLRQRKEFADVMKTIAQNTGIGSKPRDFTTTLTDGSPFTLSEQTGKVMMVDFWSTSCPPCVEELPNLRKIYAENKEKGFEIISISLDEDKEKLNAFLAENPMPWKTVFSGQGWGDDVAKLYEISWIPSIWLVDKTGTLRYFDVRGEDLKAAIDELVAE